MYCGPEKGDARLQKTDIFKKLMWFSYPREDAWIPLELDRVKEIQKQNKEGIIPADLGEKVVEDSKPAKKYWIMKTLWARIASPGSTSATGIIKRKIKTAINHRVTGPNRLPLLYREQPRLHGQKRLIQINPIITTEITAGSSQTGIITETTRIKEMKAAHKILLVILPALAILFGSGCTDPNAITDQNTAIENHNWSYSNRIKNSVKIDDPSIPYNLYINLRVTGDYRYSNIFVLIRKSGPHLQGVTRYEVKLANPDGEWLGQGSGNLYSYQVPFLTDFKFPPKGTYTFEIEQNMRDNPLREVNDVGLEGGEGEIGFF